MLGVIVNVATVILGSTIGLVFKKGISKKYSDAVMTGIGLCTVFIGISGMLKGQNVLVAIISMVLGALVGTALDIDGKLNSVGSVLQKKMKKTEDGNFRCKTQIDKMRSSAAQNNRKNCPFA